MKIGTKTAMQIFMLESFAKNSVNSYTVEEIEKGESKFLALSVLALNFARKEIREMKLTKKQKVNITKRLKDKVDVELDFLRGEGGKTSPQLLMLLILDRLVNISEYKPAKLYFANHKFGAYYDMVFREDDYKEHLKRHNDFIEKALK